MYLIASELGVYYTNCNKPDINVFPNPGTDKVTLSYSNFNMHETYISMFDYSGRLILKQAANMSGESEFNIAHLSSQIYTIRISDSQEHKYVRFTKM